jgi:hypothetical protein
VTRGRPRRRPARAASGGDDLSRAGRRICACRGRLPRPDLHRQPLRQPGRQGRREHRALAGCAAPTRGRAERDAEDLQCRRLRLRPDAGGSARSRATLHRRVSAPRDACSPATTLRRGCTPRSAKSSRHSVTRCRASRPRSRWRCSTTAPCAATVLAEAPKPPRRSSGDRKAGRDRIRLKGSVSDAGGVRLEPRLRDDRIRRDDTQIP